MSKPAAARPALIDAAVSLEEELALYEKLVAEVGRMTIGSEKSLARAARTVTEASACQQRILERVGALSEAMLQPRQRQEDAVVRMAEAARQVSQRALVFQALIERFVALREVAHALNEQAGEIGAMPGAGADPGRILPRLAPLVEGLGGAVDVADALMREARAGDFEDVARDAESLKRQMASSRNRLMQVQRALAERAPS